MLRTYQTAIIDTLRANMQAGVRSMLVTSPTGSGKTLLTAHMLKTAASKGHRAWFLVHRRELVKQSIKAFHAVGVRFGVVAAGFLEAKGHPVQIASVQTLARRLDYLRAPSMLVYDEAHHVAAGSWARIRAQFPGAYHIGLTATPERLDGKGLGEFFQTLVHGPSVAWLIEHGYLARYRLFAPGGVSTRGIHTRAGDYAKDELAKAADRPAITGDAITHYRRLCPGARAVVFAVSIEHSKHIAAQFNAAGIPAAHVDGETDAEERDRVIEAFTQGRIRVLSNVELFGEGFDVPAIEAAILLRPTQSLGLYLQQVGRALRPADGKLAAVILDHAGNVQRHGLPDEERAWTLQGRGEARRGADYHVPAVRVCPKCFAAIKPGPPACPHCGAVFQVKERQVEERDGELVEVDPEVIRAQRRREQGQARTEDELVAIGEARGYKRPRLWARHVILSRQRRPAA